MESPTRSPDLWRFLNELPDVLLWQTTHDGRLAFVSAGLARLLGMTPSEVVDQPHVWLDRVDPGHRRRYQRAIETARANYVYTDVDYRARLPGLGVTWLRDHVIADPQTGDILAITTQINEQRQTTERLTFLNKAARLFAGSLDSVQLLEEFASLMSGSLADVCIVEASGADGPRLVVRSDTSRRIRDRLESAGLMQLDGRRIPSQLRQGRPILHENLTPARLRQLIGSERLQAFGRRLPHAVIIAPLMARRQLLGIVTLLCIDANRRYTGADVDLARDVCSQAAIALDHTRLFEEAANQQARLSVENEMKDEFLALMSHELRTPLTVIYGVSRVLPELLPPLDSDSTELVDDLVAASERTVRLVDDLMLLARLNLGETPELEPVPVGPLLDEVAKDFGRQYPRREIAMEHSVRVAAKGSPPHLRQVMLNLLSNAHKYSPAQSAISIEAVQVDGEVCFRVTDAGNGVSEEELGHLFDRFYRASTAEGVSGSGMGLAICKRLIDALGGRIWAENSEQGGLRVSFSLPAWPTE